MRSHHSLQSVGHAHLNKIHTITLVIYSSLLVIVIGVLLGIFTSKNKDVEQVIKPILDFM